MLQSESRFVDVFGVNRNIVTLPAEDRACSQPFVEFSGVQFVRLRKLNPAAQELLALTNRRIAAGASNRDDRFG
jgi:hypothetical protein